jgi:hypothetical protein
VKQTKILLLVSVKSASDVVQFLLAQSHTTNSNAAAFSFPGASVKHVKEEFGLPW